MGKKRLTELERMYMDSKAVGYAPITNWGGLEVLALEDEHIVACFNYGTRNRIRRHKIQYTRSGRPFITKMGNRYYLDEIMRASV